MTGLEPARRKAYAPKAYVYTNFTTSAYVTYYTRGIPRMKISGAYAKIMTNVNEREL